MIRRPPRSTLFPYTTALPILGGDFELDSLSQRQLAAPVDRVGLAAHVGLPGVRARSEEHTSELQSQSNLVCRLLLEKKKKKDKTTCKDRHTSTPAYIEYSTYT